MMTMNWLTTFLMKNSNVKSLKDLQQKREHDTPQNAYTLKLMRRYNYIYKYACHPINDETGHCIIGTW